MLFITKKIICERIPVAKIVDMMAMKAFLFCTTNRSPRPNVSKMLTPARLPDEPTMTMKVRRKVNAKLQASQ